MKKISFKITKDINGEAIAKIKIPEKIDLDVIDVNARILSEIDGNRYLLKDSSLVEKIDDKIDNFLKKGEYVFISNGYVCIHLDNFLSAIFTLLESVDKKSINIKTLDNFMSNLEIRLYYMKGENIAHHAESAYGDAYVLDKFFLPIRCIFKESFNPKARIKLNEFSKSQLVTWLKDYDYLIDSLVLDNDNVEIATATEDSFFRVEDMDFDKSLCNKFILILEDGGEYGGPCSNNISRVYLVYVTDKEKENGKYSPVVASKHSADGWGITACMFAALSMHHAFVLEEVARQANMEIFRMRNERITAANAFSKKAIKIKSNI